MKFSSFSIMGSAVGIKTILFDGCVCSVCPPKVTILTSACSVCVVPLGTG